MTRYQRYKETFDVNAFITVRISPNILFSVIALKESLSKIQEQNEVEIYSHAQGVIDSYQG